MPTIPDPTHPVTETGWQEKMREGWGGEGGKRMERGEGRAKMHAYYNRLDAL